MRTWVPHRRVIGCAVLLTALLNGGCAETMYKLGLTSCSPAYGNWCGENYPVAGNNPKAVDDWDRACRTHDRCYDSGDDRQECDEAFLEELEDLSHSQMIPQAMLNADSYFTSNGYFQGFQSASSAGWAMGASCDGGDGRRARFYCQTPACPMESDENPGARPGDPCLCNGWPGQIVEQ